LLLGTLSHQVVTDPPYNVPIPGFVSGLGSVEHPPFIQGAGELSQQQFLELLAGSLTQASRHIEDGAILQVFMDWRGIRTLFDAGDKVGLDLLNLLVWVKSNGGMGSLYRSQHELAAVFKNGSAPHTNNMQLGKYGRNRTNVLTYAGANSFGKDRDKDLAMHPTVKPVALIEDLIKDCSHRGETVLDPFAGSGTVFIAAQNSGRRACGIELDPHYCDVALKRFRDVTGIDPVHERSALPFSVLA